MEEVLSHGKEYENIALRHDPMYRSIEVVIGVLEDFIRSNRLVIYGGLAIDYALRLHGDKIYPDDFLQVDYDFFSPENVQHAYQLADKFYLHVGSNVGSTVSSNDAENNTSNDVENDAGSNEENAAENNVSEILTTYNIRVINALHVKTMRVDIGDNHFIADLSYCPPEPFSSLNVLEYRGLKIVHPNLQRIDIHSSLSFPYDNAPFEVINHRWKKDITRFNLLDKYYPIANNSATERINTLTFDNGIIDSSGPNCVLNGFAAYGALYADVARRFGKPPGCIEGVFKVLGSKIKTIGNELELVHYDINSCVDKLSLSQVARFHPYINLTPETLVGVYVGTNTPLRTIISSTKGRLLSIVVIKCMQGEKSKDVGEKSKDVDVNTSKEGGEKSTNVGKESTDKNPTVENIRVVCAQYLLKYFLGTWLRLKMDPSYIREESPDVYLGYYVSLTKLIQFEDAKTDESDEPITGLSVQTYGTDNTNQSKEISIQRMKADRGLGEAPYLPSGYRPKGKDIAKPDFDYSRNDMYHESGEKITE